LSLQRSTKNQRGRTIINEVYNDENKVLTYQRLPSNIDILKINLDKTLNPGESIYLYFNYQIIIPESDFTKYGISKENDINIRDWFLTVSKFLNGKWLTESNLDLNDLSIDPSEFKFIISYPLDYELVTDLPLLSKYKTNINNVFESKKEVRMNTSILMQKNLLFKEYKIGDNIVITDLDNYIIKQDSLINKVVGYVNQKIGDKLMLNKLKGTNINLDSIINKTFSYVESKLGDYPFKKNYFI